MSFATGPSPRIWIFDYDWLFFRYSTLPLNALCQLWGHDSNYAGSFTDGGKCEWRTISLGIYLRSSGVYRIILLGDWNIKFLSTQSFLVFIFANVAGINIQAA